ncbi:MAG: hypothetical protein AAFR14_04845 [Bacteroidota bacterium]
MLKSLGLLTSISILIISCKVDPEERLTPVSPSIEVNLVRYDHLLPEAVSAGQSDILFRSYPEFSEVFLNQIVGLGPDPEELIQFLQDSSIHNVSRSVEDMYADLSGVEPRLAQAIENYCRLFEIPLSQAPAVYTFIGGFSYQTFVFSDAEGEGVGVGLDMFLGEKFPYGRIDPMNPAFSAYVSRAFTSEHIPKKVIEVLVEDKLPPPEGTDFLSIILWGGKKLYLMDQILTFEPDSIIHEYTAAQMRWCRSNQPEMWSFFFEKELFYDTNFRSFSKLVSPAPTSPGMPPEAPGRTGNYMGQQIINAYMLRYPETSIQQLIALQDAQQILENSRYRPG